MTNKNTMGFIEYIFEHLFWTIMSMLIFKVVLFKVVDGLSFIDSKIISYFIIIAGTILGIALTYKSRRNNLSLLVNIAIPFEIYTVYTYRNHIPGLIIAALVLAALLSIGYVLIISGVKSDDPCKDDVIRRRKIVFSLLGVRTITSICLLLVLAPLAISTIFGHSLVTSNVKAEREEGSLTWTVSNNIDQVCLFSEEKWDTISMEEKVSAMQVIANIESRYLGLPHELTLIVSQLPSGTVACYNDRTHHIEIDVEHLEDASPLEILDSICHEAYHAYQYRLCDAYDCLDDEYKTLIDFYDATLYKEEFANYINGEDDMFEYYHQQCEIKAREYAQISTEEYEMWIDEALNPIAEDNKSADEVAD